MFETTSRNEAPSFTQSEQNRAAVEEAQDLQRRTVQRMENTKAERDAAHQESLRTQYIRATQALREYDGYIKDAAAVVQKWEKAREGTLLYMESLRELGYVPEAPVQAKPEPKPTPAVPKPAQRMTATEISEWQRTPKASAQDNRILCPGGCGEKALPNQATHYVNGVRCICNAERAVASGMSRESVEAAVVTQANRLNP